MKGENSADCYSVPFFFLLSNPFLYGMCNIVMKHAEQKFSPFDRLEK